MDGRVIIDGMPNEIAAHAEIRRHGEPGSLSLSRLCFSRRDTKMDAVPRPADVPVRENAGNLTR